MDSSHKPTALNTDVMQKLSVMCCEKSSGFCKGGWKYYMEQGAFDVVTEEK